MTLLRDAELAAAFDHAATGYDRLVALNPGYHAHLRRSARRLGLPAHGAGLRLLDLGCGTGASTAALLRVAPEAEIVALDASWGMLERATAKRWPPRVRFVHAPAERLSATWGAGSFDAVFAAYLFRKVTDPDALLTTVRGVLVPHGRLAVHDYLLSGNRLHRAVWTAVCSAIVQPAGTLAGDRARYRRLRRSVEEFDTADTFRDRMRRAGFTQVRVLPMPGWQTGVVHTVLGSAATAAPDRRVIR